MNSQLNKVAAICALVIVATYVFQGQANPLGIPSYQFGVEVPLYRIKLPAFAIGNILFALSVRWVLEFLYINCLGRKLVLISIKFSAFIIFFKRYHFKKASRRQDFLGRN